MSRSLAFVAIAFGLAGVLTAGPVLIVTLILSLPVVPPAFVVTALELPMTLATSWGGARGAGVVGLFGVFVAPFLLLWGLITVQRSERGRGIVIFAATVLCVCTAPFGFGLLLCLPLLFCAILPLVRRLNAATSDGPSARS